ncbi:MAG: hypothetical protein ACTSXT_01390 [Candidatus Helarchaeota archaeon]
MKIYKDKNLKEEINVLDFETVLAGDSKEITFYVLNDTPALVIDLEFFLDNKEVEILKAPKELEPYSSSELIIQWKANVNIKKGLKGTNLNYKFKEQYR